jgi:hypothetical protein
VFDVQLNMLDDGASTTHSDEINKYPGLHCSQPPSLPQREQLPSVCLGLQQLVAQYPEAQSFKSQRSQKSPSGIPAMQTLDETYKVDETYPVWQAMHEPRLLHALHF